MDRVTRKKAKKEERVLRKKQKAEERARRRAARTPSVLLKEIWNLPNIVTLARIAVIPPFVWLAYDGDPMASAGAAFIFTLASVADVVDGFLARRMNLITVVGKFLDPLADKLMVLAALVMMTRLGRVPALIVIVLLSREFVVTGLRQIAASEGLIIAAGQEGKWKTSFQLTGIVALCIHYRYSVNFGFATYDVSFNEVGKALVYMSTLFSVWSAGVYFQAFLKTLSKRGAPAQGA